MQAMTLHLSGHNFLSQLAHTSLPATASPEQFFSEIFTLDVWDLLVRETNRYARHKISTTPPTSRGILSTWHDTCREEMMAFIGLILNMGIIQLPDIKEYWSTNHTLNFSFFRYKVYKLQIIHT